MSEKKGSIYNGETALALIVERTGHPSETVCAVLMAKDVYLAALGTRPANVLDEDVDLNEIRARYPHLFTESEQGDDTFEGEVEFVLAETGLEPKVVAEILVAETAYMVREGIMEPGAEESHREWTVKWLQRRLRDP